MKKQIPETIEGKSINRVSKCYNYNECRQDWLAQYNMLLMDGVTCGDCAHSSRCKMMFGGNDLYTSCQFYPNKFKNK